MTDKILLGYEIGSGAAVEAKLHHLFISGITQHSGKTTGLEAFIGQAGLPALVFRTGRGELGFDNAHKILPYFRERTDWRFLEALLSVHLREKTKIYRSNLMQVSRGADSLQTVWNRIRARLTGKNKARGWDLQMFTELDQYFSEFMPSLGQVKFAQKLELDNGLNVVDLEGQPVALQQLVIAASLEYIMEKMSGVIVVVPEAYKLIPIDRPSPVRLAAEAITREGMKIKNFLWLDSQQLTGLDLDILRNVDIWLFGRQTLDREKERAAKMIPGGSVKPDDIHGLTLGQFYVVQYGEKVQKIYVQPAWLEPERAQKIAKGELDVNTTFIDAPKGGDAKANFTIHAGSIEKEPDPAYGVYPLGPLFPVAGGPSINAPNPGTTEMPENPVLRMARENAQGTLSGLDSTTRMVNLLVAQQKRLDDLQHDVEQNIQALARQAIDLSELKKDLSGFAGYMGKEAKGNDQRFALMDERLNKRIDAIASTLADFTRKELSHAHVQDSDSPDSTVPVTIELRDPARIIEVSDPVEPLKVDTYSLRGQVAKLIEEGEFADGRFFNANTLSKKLETQFGSAAKWSHDVIKQELADLSAPPFRLFYLAKNQMYRVRKRKT